MRDTPTRAFVWAAILILVVSGTGLAGMVGGLRAWLENDVESQLVVRAKAARASLDPLDPSMDETVDELGRVLDARVTFIGRDGIVLGDSERDGERLTAMDNHAGRPEIVAAGADGVGVAKRFSDTLEREMMYAAVGLGEHGWVRVATPLSRVDATMARLGRIGLVAFVPVLLSALLAILLNGRLIGRGLLRSAKAAGEHLGADPLGDLQGASIARVGRELERLVRELGTSRARLLMVIETMDAGVVALDGSGRVIAVNPSARKLLGLEDSAGDLPGSRMRERVPQLFGSPAAGVDEAQLEIDGRVMTLTTKAGAAADGSRVAVVRDVTEQRRADTVRRDFVANASHELRTPVAAIQAQAETLLSGALEDPTAARRFAEGIHRHSIRLSALLTDLLDLSRIEAGRLAVDLTPLNVALAFERAQEIVGRKAALADVALVHIVEPDLRLLGDAGALDQILVNLLDNAVKYSPPGGRVELVGRSDGRRVLLEIRDQGRGIELRHRRRLFERFYRVDPGRDRAIGGTGLGLAIVKHLAGAMHGTVGMQPNTPTGSRFWVSLPGV